MTSYIYNMKIVLLALWLSVVCSVNPAPAFTAKEKILSDGSQPQVAIDPNDIIRVVYGQNDKIYCLESADNGSNFSKPVLVGQITDMHLGMSRGPQLASSRRYSVITAMDKSGNIHWFRLDHSSGKWAKMGLINDRAGSAPEGLMHLAADGNDHFYAVWLDMRTGGHNQIYFSDLSPNATRWCANKLLYKSPDGHVCECCQPHIAVNGTEVSVMFRNWLNGSRDLYLLTSHNSGVSFAGPQKIGMGTWKLNGCPMDGGGLVVNPASVQTTWQRRGSVYYCKPGQAEIGLGSGRESTIAGTGSQTVIGYQSRDTLKVVNLANRKSQAVGTGEFIKLAVLQNRNVICVWERNNKIVFKKL